MKKRLFISAGIILAIASTTVGILYFIKQTQPTSTPASTSETLVLDHSKDYGACTLLDISSIKSALGDVATNLQPMKNIGITKDTYFGSDVENIVSDSQACIYAFVPGGNADNGFNASNSFVIQNTVFTNSDGPAALIKQIKQDTSIVSIDSLGDSAFYNANDIAEGPGAIYSFNLRVFTDMKATNYTINQPADSATFNAESAKAALTQLAKLAQQPK